MEFYKLEKFDALYNYALADKKFKNFHNKKNDERKKFIQQVKKDIKNFLDIYTEFEESEFCQIHDNNFSRSSILIFLPVLLCIIFISISFLIPF